MAAVIRIVLTHLPLVLWFLALLIAAVRRDGRPASRRFLAWLLLLSVGVESVWGGVFHVFFPQVAAASIGWQVSPFQYEVGVADLSIGLVAIAAFRRSLAFQSAVVAMVVLFYIGVTVGHVRDAVEAGNFASNNFGVLLLLTVAKAVILPLLLTRAWRSES